MQVIIKKHQGLYGVQLRYLDGDYLKALSDICSHGSDGDGVAARELRTAILKEIEHQEQAISQ